MPPSSHTLLGRVYEHARLEGLHDVEGLYAFLDPVIRIRREQERDDEPERSLAVIRSFVEGIGSVEVEEIEIEEARKVCERYGGRPAARVRSIVRYDGEPPARASLRVWVRDQDVWYSTELAGGS